MPTENKIAEPLNAADQRIDELTAKPSDAECERLIEISRAIPERWSSAIQHRSKRQLQNRAATPPFKVSRYSGKGQVSPMETEILSDEELADLTGYKARAYQRRWLVDRQWVFVESRGNAAGLLRE